MQNGYEGSFQSDKSMTARDIQSLGGQLGVEPKRTPPMDVSLRELTENVQRLQASVQVLASKIDPVLYPEPPAPNVTQAVEARAPRASSSLGNQVNNLADQLSGIERHIVSLTRRCEL